MSRQDPQPVQCSSRKLNIFSAANRWKYRNIPFCLKISRRLWRMTNKRQLCLAEVVIQQSQDYLCNNHTVTDLARLRGQSGSIPFKRAICSTKIWIGTIERRAEVYFRWGIVRMKSYLSLGFFFPLSYFSCFYLKAVSSGSLPLSSSDFFLISFLMPWFHTSNFFCSLS